MKSTIPIILQSGIPVMLWSSPGQGKSAWTQALGRSLDAHLETLIGSIYDPTDIGGQPMRVNGHCEFALPGWFERLTAAKNPRRMLYMDELTCCPQSTQAALLRVVQERSIHHHSLPADTMIIASGNPPDQAAAGVELAPPMANRFAHFDWISPTDDWVDGMLAGWPDPSAPILPANWRAEIPQARAVIASYIRTSPTSLHALPSDEAQRGRAWPSHRTWNLAAVALAAHSAVHADPSDSIGALVGDGAALAFLTWRRQQDLPDPEEVLAKADSYELPERDDAAFIVLTSVVAAVCARNNPDRWDRAWRVLTTAVKAGKPDLGAVAARTLAKNMPPCVKKVPGTVAAFLPVLQQAGLIAAGSTP